MASGLTTRNRLPKPISSDAFTPTADIGALADLLDLVLPPIGACIPYTGISLPAGTYWDLADGHLVDRGAGLIGEFFYAAVGHAYNGGVDPGSGKVRLPDKRGRASVGADNMGTVLYGTSAGAGGRTPNSNRARGQNGGSERVALIAANNAPHAHDQAAMGVGPASAAGQVGDNNDRPAVMQGNAQTGTRASGANVTVTQGSGTPHETMQPFEVDLMIVRLK